MGRRGGGRRLRPYATVSRLGGVARQMRAVVRGARQPHASPLGYWSAPTSTTELMVPIGLMHRGVCGQQRQSPSTTNLNSCWPADRWRMRTKRPSWRGILRMRTEDGSQSLKSPAMNARCAPGAINSKRWRGIIASPFFRGRRHALGCACRSVSIAYVCAQLTASPCMTVATERAATCGESRVPAIGQACQRRMHRRTIRGCYIHYRRRRSSCEGSRRLGTTQCVRGTPKTTAAGPHLGARLQVHDAAIQQA